MVNVAVAGGTGGIGRTLIEVLASSPHNSFILSRQTGPHMITVNYDDIDSLVETLESNDIHTVISAFGINNSSLAKSQANLIEAAKRSRLTKRFVPTSFAIPYPEDAVEVLPQLEDYFAAIETLRKSDLEFTVFHCGLLLDYYGGPGFKSQMKHNIIVIDLANKMAAIPGDGNAPVTFTYTIDLAKFVVASLDLTAWEEESRAVGDTLTWNEFLSLAEETVGAKFEVHYDSIEKLKRFEITELPSHRPLYETVPKENFQGFMSIFELFTATGKAHIKRKGALNDRFPEINVLSVRDLLERHWMGVKGQATAA
ncbi:uncharacterized protein BDV14DRAFT_198887 [Aspergillus stella-maris]|uniref:uncharacterized protein n=1 Tax=Aspergillus stella-maris TaxID=1810926 RepID=UPI003CCD7F0C